MSLDEKIESLTKKVDALSAKIDSFKIITEEDILKAIDRYFSDVLAKEWTPDLLKEHLRSCKEAECPWCKAVEEVAYGKRS